MRSISENIIYYTTKEKFKSYEKTLTPKTYEEVKNSFEPIKYKGCPLLYFDGDVVFKKADL